MYHNSGELIKFKKWNYLLEWSSLKNKKKLIDLVWSLASFRFGSACIYVTMSSDWKEVNWNFFNHSRKNSITTGYCRWKSKLGISLPKSTILLEWEGCSPENVLLPLQSSCRAGCLRGPQLFLWTSEIYKPSVWPLIFIFKANNMLSIREEPWNIQSY